MRWLESFSLVVRSSINTLIEKVEDPERMLHQLVLDMEEELERVRESVAEAMADEIRLGKEAAEARRAAEGWARRAAESLERGDEASARSALEKKLSSEKRAKELEESHCRQRGETAKLERSVRDLEGTLEEERQKLTLLLARLAAADSDRKIQRAFDRAGERSAFRQFHRLEERVDRAEALAEAHARLSGRDPEAEDLERQLEEKERQEAVEKQLGDLKRQKAEGGGA
ncbi:MAG: PspA/IM30 family protein [Planctomycetes bacterium]|nr:PspA/IM30 family protein [Planctomycetota bacterium]